LVVAADVLPRLLVVAADVHVLPGAFVVAADVFPDVFPRVLKQ